MDDLFGNRWLVTTFTDYVSIIDLYPLEYEYNCVEIDEEIFIKIAKALLEHYENKATAADDDDSEAEK